MLAVKYDIKPNAQHFLILRNFSLSGYLFLKIKNANFYWFYLKYYRYSKRNEISHSSVLASHEFYCTRCDDLKNNYCQSSFLSLFHLDMADWFTTGIGGISIGAISLFVLSWWRCAASKSSLFRFFSLMRLSISEQGSILSTR